MFNEEIVAEIKRILDETPLYMQTKINERSNDPVQYIGIHVLRWKTTYYPEPECGFIEARAMKEKIRTLLEELVEVI